MQPGDARVTEADINGAAAPDCGDVLQQRYDRAAFLDADEWVIHDPFLLPVGVVTVVSRSSYPAGTDSYRI